MSNFRDQNWQLVFTKAAFQMQLPFQVELIENVDADFIAKSSVCTYMLTNLEVVKTHSGADVYFAKPVLERIMRQQGTAELGQTLQFTRPQVLPASCSENVMNTALRYAFVTRYVAEEFVEETETEAERIAREEDEEFQRLLEEEEREKAEQEKREREAAELAEKEKLEADEKERLEKEQNERAEELKRLHEAELAAQKASQNPTEPSGTPAVQVEQADEDDQFEEEQR